MTGNYPTSEYDLAVGRALKVSVDLLDKEDKIDLLALDLLKWSSSFAPGELIPIELLRAIAEKKETNPKVFEGGLYRLLGLGLINENKSGQLRLHELISDFVQHILPDEAGCGTSNPGDFICCGGRQSGEIPRRHAADIGSFKIHHRQGVDRKI